MQPILPVATQSGFVAAMLAELALAQLGGELRLQDVVSAGRAAANMPFGDFGDRKAGVAQEPARLFVDALAMLHRAGRMIGDANVGPARRRADVDDVGQEFGDVLGERADALCARSAIAGSWASMWP